MPMTTGGLAAMRITSRSSLVSCLWDCWLTCASDIVIDDPFLSRRHLEFYTVIFDEEHYPMLYVRDRGSTSGTYVNGKLIGGRETGDDKVSPGTILRHGDVVSVGEDVKFEVVHPFIPKLRLNEVQTKEVLVSLFVRTIWFIIH